MVAKRYLATDLILIWVHMKFETCKTCNKTVTAGVRLKPTKLELLMYRQELQLLVPSHKRQYNYKLLRPRYKATKVELVHFKMTVSVKRIETFLNVRGSSTVWPHNKQRFAFVQYVALSNINGLK